MTPPQPPKKQPKLSAASWANARPLTSRPNTAAAASKLITPVRIITGGGPIRTGQQPGPSANAVPSPNEAPSTNTPAAPTSTTAPMTTSTSTSAPSNYGITFGPEITRDDVVTIQTIKRRSKDPVLEDLLKKRVGLIQTFEPTLVKTILEKHPLGAQALFQVHGGSIGSRVGLLGHYPRVKHIREKGRYGLLQADCATVRLENAFLRPQGLTTDLTHNLDVYPTVDTLDPRQDGTARIGINESGQLFHELQALTLQLAFDMEYEEHIVLTKRDAEHLRDLYKKNGYSSKVAWSHLDNDTFLLYPPAKLAATRSPVLIGNHDPHTSYSLCLGAPLLDRLFASGNMDIRAGAQVAIRDMELNSLESLPEFPTFIAPPFTRFLVKAHGAFSYTSGVGRFIDENTWDGFLQLFNGVRTIPPKKGLPTYFADLRKLGLDPFVAYFERAWSPKKVGNSTFATFSGAQSIALAFDGMTEAEISELQATRGAAGGNATHARGHGLFDPKNEGAVSSGQSKVFYAAANMQLPSDELYYWIADKCCYGLHCTKKSDAKSGAVHHLCSEVGKLVEAQMLADGHVAFRAKNGNGGGKEDVSEVEEENGNGAGVADAKKKRPYSPFFYPERPRGTPDDPIVDCWADHGFKIYELRGFSTLPNTKGGSNKWEHKPWSLPVEQTRIVLLSKDLFDVLLRMDIGDREAWALGVSRDAE